MTHRTSSYLTVLTRSLRRHRDVKETWLKVRCTRGAHVCHSAHVHKVRCTRALSCRTYIVSYRTYIVSYRTYIVICLIAHSNVCDTAMCVTAHILLTAHMSLSTHVTEHTCDMSLRCTSRTRLIQIRPAMLTRQRASQGNVLTLGPFLPPVTPVLPCLFP